MKEGKKIESFGLKELLEEYQDVRGTGLEKEVFSVLKKRIDENISEAGNSDELIYLYQLLWPRRAEKFFEDKVKDLKGKILFALLTEFKDFKRECSSVMEAKNKMEELLEFFPYGVYKNPYAELFEKKLKSLFVPLFEKGALDSKTAVSFLRPYGKSAFLWLRRELDELRLQEFREKLFAADTLDTAKRFQYNISIESREYRLAKEYIDLFYEEMYEGLAMEVKEMFKPTFRRMIFSSHYKQRYDNLKERVEAVYRDVYDTGLRGKYLELHHYFVFDELNGESKKAWNKEKVIEVLKKVPDKPRFFEIRKYLEEKYKKMTA